jgi:hypothetical protein
MHGIGWKGIALELAGPLLLFQKCKSERSPRSNIFAERSKNLSPRGMIEFTIDDSL